MSILWVIFLCCVSCCRPHTPEYCALYQHLNHMPTTEAGYAEEDFYLVLLVDARHLDYTDCRSFIRTVSKHPDDGSKSGDIGHAWVYVRGIVDGQVSIFEGGHSGETGRFQARYFDGIMNNIDYGYPNPTAQQRLSTRYEPNPVQYLWEVQRDGFCQCGSGSHHPTFAIRVSLTAEQYCCILRFIEQYDFSKYSLQNNQCTTFAVQIASMAGLQLSSNASIQIPSTLSIGGETIRLWSDPSYTELIVPTPDLLEKSMMEAVHQGKAEPSLDWYQKTHGKTVWSKLKSFGETLRRFPERFERYLAL